MSQRSAELTPVAGEADAWEPYETMPRVATPWSQPDMSERPTARDYARRPAPPREPERPSTMRATFASSADASAEGFRDLARSIERLRLKNAAPGPARAPEPVDPPRQRPARTVTYTARYEEPAPQPAPRHRYAAEPMHEPRGVDAGRRPMHHAEPQPAPAPARPTWLDDVRDNFRADPAPAHAPQSARRPEAASFRGAPDPRSSAPEPRGSASETRGSAGEPPRKAPEPPRERELLTLIQKELSVLATKGDVTRLEEMLTHLMRRVVALEEDRSNTRARERAARMSARTSPSAAAPDLDETEARIPTRQIATPPVTIERDIEEALAPLQAARAHAAPRRLWR
ncbi:hypothetical protein [Acuticoccus kandeliae]|uniref:hypothetical protein n=1 Tax=Acuticoccus kandeliae TaxID=2073160 RepID=UPI000D3EDF8F|nr:hypothetical protein [Acuticoccus kandeliae]